VKEQLKADNKEVEAFYQAQHLTRTGVKENVGSIFSTDSTVGQTAARLNKILAAYPTSAKLYRTVVSKALDPNEDLCASIADTIRNAIPPNQRQRLADHLEAIGNHTGRPGEYGYDHGHHHQGGTGAHRHHPHEHGIDGHHLGPHHRKHDGDRHHAHHHPEHFHPEEGYGVDEGRGYREGARTHLRYASRHTEAPYPRHETHLTREEATQAQIRSYVASGFVPPAFETFAEMEARTQPNVVPPIKTQTQTTSQPQPGRQSVQAKVPTTTATKAPSKSIPNVTREAPSLDPPAAKASTVRLRSGANTFPVDFGVSAKDGAKAVGQVFAQAPPPLETAAVAQSAPPPRVGLQAREPPSTGPMAKRTPPATTPVTSSYWSSEMPSMEHVAPVASSAVSQATTTTKSRPPPPIEYVNKVASPSTPKAVPVPPPSSSSSLPSLAEMIKAAVESSRVH
jgi:hypothetical protein